ncbi:MAG: NusA N-terminal domain-containing protein [Acidimicrobiales bacterium]
MSVVDNVTELLGPVIDTLGVELIDVEWVGSSLRIVVDEADGITTDRLADVNRLISPILDQHDPVPGRYTLEVSSPGVERKLTKPLHYARAIGEDVVVKLEAGNRPGESRAASSAFDEAAGTITVEAVELDGVDLASPETHLLADGRSSPTSPRPAPSSPGVPLPRSAAPRERRRRPRSRPPRRNPTSAPPVSPGPVSPRPRSSPRSNSKTSSTHRRARNPTRRQHEARLLVMSNEMIDALQALAEDRGISVEKLFGIMANALESAYKRQPDSYEYSWVTIDPATFDIRVWAQEIDEDGEPFGDEYDVTPENFGRIAAQTTKQILMQGIREVEREQKYEEYAGKEGEIVTGIVQQTDSLAVPLDLGRVEALLPPAEQVSVGHSMARRAPRRPTSSRSARPPGPQIGSAARPRSGQAVVRTRGSRDRRRHRRPKAVAREPDTAPAIAVSHDRTSTRSAPRRRSTVRARDGRERVERREGRHHPLQRGHLRLVAKALSPAQVNRGPDPRRHRHRRGHRSRFPAVARHRQGGPERPARSPPDRLAHRHQVRDPAGRGGPRDRRLRHRGMGTGRVDRRSRDR